MQPSKSPAFPFTILGGQLQAGWWYTYPSEKYESPVGMIIPCIMEN